MLFRKKSVFEKITPYGSKNVVIFLYHFYGDTCVKIVIMHYTCPMTCDNPYPIVIMRIAGSMEMDEGHEHLLLTETGRSRPSEPWL